MADQLECSYYLDWKKVPHLSCIMKFNFDEDYNVLLSNFVHVYGEELKGPEAVNRFNVKNPLVEINPVVLFKHLKRTLEHSIENNESLNLHQQGDKLVLSLQFSVMQVPCEYSIILSILPQQEMLRLIISPLMLNSCLNYLSCIGYKRKTEGTKDKPPNEVTTHCVNSLSSSASSAIPSVYDNSNPEIARIKDFEASMMSGNEVSFPKLVQAFVDIQHQQRNLLSDNVGVLKRICLGIPIPENFTYHHENSVGSLEGVTQLKMSVGVPEDSYPDKITTSEKPSASCSEENPHRENTGKIERSPKNKLDVPTSCKHQVKKKKVKRLRL